MFVHAETPDSILQEELDTYLANGWFRMGQTIFTTQFLCFKNTLYNAIWLRIDLKHWQNEPAQLKLFKKNRHFRTEIRKATYSDEHAQLFQFYKEGVSFEGSATLHQLLFGSSANNIYNTFEVNVYDEDRLIACGIFDLGKEAAAGISCFYNHAYKKYSLGKYLIYLKLKYCQALGMDFFYPGYYVPGYQHFDYKLGIGKSALQFWQLVEQVWKPIEQAEIASFPLALMAKKLSEAKQLFEKGAHECLLLRYEFFDANLVPHLQGSYLFDYPILIYPFDLHDDSVYPVIVFNVFENCYQLLQVRSIWVANSPITDLQVYSSHVLKIDKVIFASANPEELLMLLKMASISN